VIQDCNTLDLIWLNAAGESAPAILQQIPLLPKVFLGYEAAAARQTPPEKRKPTMPRNYNAGIREQMQHRRDNTLPITESSTDPVRQKASSTISIPIYKRVNKTYEKYHLLGGLFGCVITYNPGYFRNILKKAKIPY